MAPLGAMWTYLDPLGLGRPVLSALTSLASLLPLHVSSEVGQIAQQEIDNQQPDIWPPNTSPHLQSGSDPQRNHFSHSLQNLPVAHSLPYSPLYRWAGPGSFLQPGLSMFRTLQSTEHLKKHNFIVPWLSILVLDSGCLRSIPGFTTWEQHKFGPVT